MGKTELVVALDYATLDGAEDLIAELEGLPVIYKVGLELFLTAGPDWINLLTQSGERVFLDLKFHDIPTTVGQAIMKASEVGPEFLSLHLTGGIAMLDEVNARLKEAKNIGARIRKNPKIMGVSILSSFHEEDWNITMQRLTTGVRPIEESVLEFSTLAANHHAISGLICSPHELGAIRNKHPNLFLMVSGIRPVGAFKHDQQWTMTPAEAVKAGASAIIVGRPIRQAENSREMTEAILAELDASLLVAA